MKTVIFAALLLCVSTAQAGTWSYSDSEDEQYFNGYPCTDDCSRHKAGYQWAEDNDIDDANDCPETSESFNEGCISYVEENYEGHGDNSYGYRR